MSVFTARTGRTSSKLVDDARDLIYVCRGVIPGAAWTWGFGNQESVGRARSKQYHLILVRWRIHKPHEIQ